MATFPILKTPELVVSLQDIGNPHLTADDIDRPTSSRIIHAYLWFWSHTTSSDLEEVKMAAQLWLEGFQQQQREESTSGNSAAIDDAALSEMLAESVHSGVLWLTLNQMMRWAMVDDFSVRDLRDPQASRVRKLLSALINFHLFELEQAPLIDKLEEGFERDEDERARSQMAVEQMQRKIEEKRVQLEREAEEVTRLGKENAERRARLIRAKEMEEPALAKIERAKQHHRNLQDKVNRVVERIKQYQFDIQRLQGRILKSPERVKQSLTDMTRSLESLRKQIADLDTLAREHESRIDAAKRYAVDITGVIKLLNEWMAEIKSAEDTAEKLEALIEQRDKANDDLRGVNLKLQQLARRSKDTAEQIANQEVVALDKKDSIRAKMAKLQEDYERERAEKEKSEHEHKIKVKEIRALENQIAELVKLTDNEMARAAAAYKELRDDVLTYSAKLNKALDSLSATIQRPYEA